MEQRPPRAPGENQDRRGRDDHHGALPGIIGAMICAMVWIQDTKALVHLRIAYVGNGAIENVDYIESKLTTEKHFERSEDGPVRTRYLCTTFPVGALDGRHFMLHITAVEATT